MAEERIWEFEVCVHCGRWRYGQGEWFLHWPAKERDLQENGDNYSVKNTCCGGHGHPPRHCRELAKLDN